jgi:hypothetical protein
VQWLQLLLGGRKFRESGIKGVITMAAPEETPKAVQASASAMRFAKASEIGNASVKLSGENRLPVEFRIDDLVKRLLPNGGALTSCGGCNGCTGCSM